MKNVLFILAINFLIYKCTAVSFSGTANYFLGFLGRGSPAQYKEIPTAPETEGPKIEPIYEPLELLVVKIGSGSREGVIGNPIFLRHDILADGFIDAVYFCPKADGGSEGRRLVFKKSFVTLGNKYIEEANLSEETYESKENDAQDGKNGKVSIAHSNQQQQPNQNAVSLQENIKKDVPKHTPMEIDSTVTSGSNDENLNSAPSPKQGTNSSSKNKTEHSDSSENLPVEDQTASKKNKTESLDQQGEKKETGSGQSKMEIDTGSIHETNGTDLKKNETDSAPIQETAAVPSKTETFISNLKPVGDKIYGTLTYLMEKLAETPQKTEKKKSSGAKFMKSFSKKFNASAQRGVEITPKNEEYWLRALEEVENFKCERPVRPHLKLYSSNDDFNFYVASFEIDVDGYEDFHYAEFVTPEPNQKIKWIWIFSIMFSKKDQSVSVYHEVQYNKDTYNPKINDDFDDHDLGNDDMFPGLDIIKVYGIENQENVFGNLFENEDERKKYFDVGNGKFLQRLHLAPLHGFISPLLRKSAKTYGNIAPMWESIKTGAWGILEEYVNILSTVLVHVIVVTGTYGTLKLDGKEVYLANDKKIPVPLAFWKLVIYGDQLDEFPGTLLVTSNNPYEDIGNIICKENKCRNLGWGYVQDDDLRRGRTICCDFNSDMLSELPVLKDTQPTSALNLDEIFSIVDKVWKFDEEGAPTTSEQRKEIFDRLKKVKNSDGKMTTADEKIAEIVENRDTETKDVDMKDAENKDPKAELIVPQLHQ